MLDPSKYRLDGNYQQGQRLTCAFLRGSRMGPTHFSLKTIRPYMHVFVLHGACFVIVSCKICNPVFPCSPVCRKFSYLENFVKKYSLTLKSMKGNHPSRTTIL